MEMPIGNEVIYIFSDGTTQKAVLAMREILETGKAIPVPEHGDLIDRDATIEKIRHLSDEIDKKLGYKKSAPYITMDLYLSNADDFPTIIPADKEGANGN